MKSGTVGSPHPDFSKSIEKIRQDQPKNAFDREEEDDRTDCQPRSRDSPLSDSVVHRTDHFLIELTSNMLDCRAACGT